MQIKQGTLASVFSVWVKNYLKSYVLCVDYHLPGVKSGAIAGKK